MKKLLYAELQKKHGGQFIARKGSKLLAWAPTLGALHKVFKAKKIPYTTDVTIGYIDPRWAVCV